jgi:hypothetical protein
LTTSFDLLFELPSNFVYILGCPMTADQRLVDNIAFSIWDEELFGTCANIVQDYVQIFYALDEIAQLFWCVFHEIGEALQLNEAIANLYYK